MLHALTSHRTGFITCWQVISDSLMEMRTTEALDHVPHAISNNQVRRSKTVLNQLGLHGHSQVNNYVVCCPDELIRVKHHGRWLRFPLLVTLKSSVIKIDSSMLCRSHPWQRQGSTHAHMALNAVLHLSGWNGCFGLLLLLCPTATTPSGLCRQWSRGNVLVWRWLLLLTDQAASAVWDAICASLPPSS